MDEVYVKGIMTAFQVPAEYFPDLLNRNKPSSDIIPDIVQSELVMLREKKRDIYFRIGDIANDLTLMHQGTVTAKKVYEAMSPYCDCSPRTIRYYAETAGFFSPATRDKYDMLSFTHFDVARNYKDHWQSVLEVASANPNIPSKVLNEKIKSVLKSMCEINFSQENPVCDPVLKTEEAEAIERAKRFFAKLECEVAPVVVGGTCRGGGVMPIPLARDIPANSAMLVGEIAELSEKVIQLVDGYGDKLPEDMKGRLIGHLVGINREVPAITVALDTYGAK